MPSGLSAMGLLMFSLGPGSLVGCSQNPESTSASIAENRDNPVAAFDEIAGRCLRGDAAYVRAHLADAYVAEATKKGIETDSEAFVERAMNKLRVFRGLSWESADSEDEGTLVAGGVPLGRLMTFRIRMVWDPSLGWRLSSLPFDEGPLKSGGG